jgi:cytochrome c-type biogenesis protein CcmH/NrfG
LGVIAMQQKRWADAERYLQGSLQMEPEDAKTWFNLARVRREAGNTAGAREAATRALQIQPGNAGVQAFLEQLDKAAVIPP